MASKEVDSHDMEKNEWDEVEEEITCSICKEIFIEPKTITCLHTFCDKCITSTIESKKRLGSDNCCPLCRAKFPEDATKIPVNFYIKRLIEIFKKRKISLQQTKNEMKCGECKANAPAVVWCMDCESFQCQECYQLHERLKALRSHSTMTLETFMQDPKKMLPSTCKPELCKTHNAQPLDLYCQTCNILICRDCTIVDHRQHQYNFVNKLADEERAKIKMAVAPLKTMLEQVNTAIKKVEDVDNELNNETDGEGQVRDMYRQLHEMLDQCEVKDMQKVKAAKMRLLDLLSSQKGNLKLLQACLISCDEFVSKVTAREGASQLLTYSNDIQNRVKDLTNQVEQSSLEPVCGVDHMILSTSNPNDYASHFTSLCTVSTLPHGDATIRDYTHIQQESLIINKYGPNNKRLKLSYFLAIGPSDELICREYSAWPDNVARLVVFNDQLQYSHIIGDTTCRCPTGIAVNKEGHIYVVDFILCKIFKFKMNGQLVGEIGRKGSGNCQFKEPRGLASSSRSNLLFVCDSENNRIQVLQDDKFAYSFGKQGTNYGCFKCPVAIALTHNEDQLFVSDCYNHRIQVFSIGGEFLRIFGNFTNTTYKLNRPYGIFCVSDGYVLVTSRDANCILIFDKEGQVVSAIEGTYQGRQRFNDPIGVVMRKNGQIVIAAHGSQNIAVF